MKPQDMLFVILLIGLLVWRKPKVLVWAGLLCLLLSIPLFAHWVFFTAQRLVMYAAGFFFTVIIYFMFTNKE